MGFDPVSAVISAGAGLGGQVAGMAWSHNQAINQRNWQSDMANSSYQRAVRDLRQAGLNPMLAYTQGGAATPTGAMAQMENVAEGTISNALEAARMKTELAAVEAQTDKLKQDTKVGEAQEINAYAQASAAAANARNATANAKIVESNIGAAEKHGKINQSTPAVILDTVLNRMEKVGNAIPRLKFQTTPEKPDYTKTPDWRKP